MRGVTIRYEAPSNMTRLRRRKVNLAGEAANLKLAHPDLCAEYGNADLAARL